MALTPRSFLRSPTLLVALVLSGGMALLGAVLFVGTYWCSGETGCQRVVVEKAVDPLGPLRGGGCDHLLRESGSLLASWQHEEWVNLSVCFENHDDNARAARAAGQGLSYYPASERLYNIRGYNLIVLEEYEKAVSHLRVALQAIEPTDGTLENNLAWAGLYASDRMTLSEARRHYRASLALGGSCEAYHTGMWVEYGIASRASGTSRDEALEAYDDLRAKYAPCTSRVDSGDRITGFEVAGAGILDGEMHKLKMVQMFERNQIDDGFAPLRTELVARSLPAMNLAASDVEAACDEIAPVRSAMPACRKELRAAMYGRR